VDDSFARGLLDRVRAAAESVRRFDREKETSWRILLDTGPAKDTRSGMIVSAAQIAAAALGATLVIVGTSETNA
jgi:hypothetical protein